MNQEERRFDFHGLGLALKQAREEKDWTQAYVAELIGKTDRTIMNIENKGQHPSFNLFFKLITLFDISVGKSVPIFAEHLIKTTLNFFFCAVLSPLRVDVARGQ